MSAQPSDIMPESERFKRDKILHDLERAVLAACVEERRAFELRQALPSQIEAVTRYDDAIRARRAAVTQYVAALDANRTCEAPKKKLCPPHVCAAAAIRAPKKEA